MPEDRLTPAEAKKRFGELREPRTHTFVEFATPEGDWRPVLGAGMTLEEYRLYRTTSGANHTHWSRANRKR